MAITIVFNHAVDKFIRIVPRWDSSQRTYHCPYRQKPSNWQMIHEFLLLQKKKWNFSSTPNMSISLSICVCVWVRVCTFCVFFFFILPKIILKLRLRHDRPISCNIYEIWRRNNFIAICAWHIIAKCLACLPQTMSEVDATTMMMCPATLLHRRPTATTTPPLYSNLCNKREMAPNVCPARVPLSLHMLEHVRGACESYLYSVQFFFFLSLSLSHCVCLFLYFALFVVAAKAYLSSQSRYYSRNELCVCVAFVRLRYNKCMFYIIFFFFSS